MDESRFPQETDRNARNLQTEPMKVGTCNTMDQTVQDVAPATGCRRYGSRRAWWTIALLCSLYIVSYVDRIIPSLLVGPLKAEFNVGDAQLGLLFGAAFAVFYGLLGLPGARLADRSNRKVLILFGVMVWSLCTMASGLAASFTALIVLRIGVAVGEAVLSPAAYSMIGDMFAPGRRFLPSAIYAASGNVGTYGAYIAGAGVLGWVSSNGQSPALFLSHISVWQAVFICVGLPGLLISLVFWLTTSEPLRSDTEASQANGLYGAASFFAGNARLFGGLFLGASLITIVIFAYGAWAPEYLHRSLGWPIERAGLAYGVTGLCCSVLGTLAFSRLAEAMTRKGLADGLVLASSLGAFLGCLSAGIAAMVTDPSLVLTSLGVMVFCLSGCSNLIVISNQFIVPDRFRATAIAIMFMCTILIGLGIGPPLVAWLSPQSPPQPADLGPALALVSFAVLIPATALILCSRKQYADRINSNPT